MYEVDNEVDNQEQQMEQPVEGTPQDDGDKEPEFYLDDDGKLQWNTDEFDDDDDEDSDTQPAQEENEEQSEDSEDDDSEVNTEDEPKYTVKVDGEEVEVTQEELLRGYMRQRDYTQKTQALAEQRRQIEQYRPQYQQPQYPPQNQGYGGENLNAVAKQIAASRLGLDSPDDLSELDFDHITAVVEAKQALLNQRNTIMYRQ